MPIFAVVFFVKNDTSDEVGCFFSSSNEQDIIKQLLPVSFVPYILSLVSGRSITTLGEKVVDVFVICLQNSMKVTSFQWMGLSIC